MTNEDIVDLIRCAAEAQDYSGTENGVGDVLDAAADEIERLRAALATYGGHAEECDLHFSGPDCDCGWDAVAAVQS